MVARGIRKRFNDDLDAQKASIEWANYQHQADLDNECLRQSVAWYDVKCGWWLEVEATVAFGGHKMAFNSYPDKPERFIKTAWGIKDKGTEEFHETEAGFIADGLPHAVWVSGGTWRINHRDRSTGCQFDHETSKIKLHQQLIVNISRLPQIFFDLYGIRLSIPMIQQAFKEYQNAAQDT